MITCSTCGKKLDTPDRKIQNTYFTIAVYTCGKCGTRFKEMR